jgi:hypothetical protein
MNHTIPSQLKPGSYTWLTHPEMGSKAHMLLALDTDPEKGWLLMPLSHSTTKAANKPWQMNKSIGQKTYNAWDKAKWWTEEELLAALATSYLPTALNSSEWQKMQESLEWELHWAKKSTSKPKKLAAADLLEKAGY